MTLLINAFENPVLESALDWEDLQFGELVAYLDESLLEERSVRDLWRTAIKAFPNTRKRQKVIDRVKVEGFRWTPFLGVRTLLLSSRVLGEAYVKKPRKTYESMILFKNVEFSRQPAAGLLKLKEESPPVWFKKLTMGQDIRLRCSCPDFRWRFSWEDLEVKALYGPKAPPYTPPNPERYRGPANPSGLPGLCKHTMATALTLIKAGAASL